MRFIGNKENLLEQIHAVTVDLGADKGSFCDFFSGTSNVGRFFKEKGFSILSSDLLYFSYVLQKAYIENNEEVSFKKLLKEPDNESVREELEAEVFRIYGLDEDEQERVLSWPIFGRRNR